MDPYTDEDLELTAAIPYLTGQAKAQALRQPRPRALPSMPTGGVETPQPSPGADPRTPTPAPTVAGLRQQAYEAANTASERAAEIPDTAAMQATYRRRYEGAGPDMALAWMLGERGGATGREMSGQILQNAIAARAPEQTPYGTLDYGGFTANPFKQRELEVQRMLDKAKILEGSAHHMEDANQRRVANEQANEIRREALDLKRTIAANRGGAGGPLVPVFDPATQQKVYMPRSQAAGMAVPPRGGAGGRPLTATEVDKITGDEGKVAQFSSLVSTWKPEYGGMGTGVGNFVGRNSPISSEAQRSQAQWWQQYQAFVNDVRHQQFGAALTPTEQAEFEKAIVTPNTDPRMVNTFLQTQLKVAENSRARRVANLGRAGYDVRNFGGGEPQQQQPGAPGPRNAPGVTNFPATGAGVVDFSSLK